MSQHIDAMPSRSEVSALNDNITALSETNNLADYKNDTGDHTHTSATGRTLDLNAIVETGAYSIEGASNGPNSGTSNYGCLSVIRYSDTNYVTQIWQSVVDDKIYIRKKLGGTWSAWNELALNAKIRVFEIGQIRSGTIVDAIKAAAKSISATILGDITIKFYLTSSHTPSDAPGSGFTRQYGFGEFICRNLEAGAPNLDGTLIFYGWNSTQRWIRTVGNGTWGSWKDLGSGS